MEEPGESYPTSPFQLNRAIMELSSHILVCQTFPLGIPFTVTNGRNRSKLELDICQGSDYTHWGIDFLAFIPPLLLVLLSRQAAADPQPKSSGAEPFKLAAAVT